MLSVEDFKNSDDRCFWLRYSSPFRYMVLIGTGILAVDFEPRELLLGLRVPRLCCCGIAIMSSRQYAEEARQADTKPVFGLAVRAGPASIGFDPTPVFSACSSSPVVPFPPAVLSPLPAPSGPGALFPSLLLACQCEWRECSGMGSRSLQLLSWSCCQA